MIHMNGKIIEEWWIDDESCPSDIYLKAGRRLLGPFNKNARFPEDIIEWGMMRNISLRFPTKCLKIPYKRLFKHFRVVQNDIMIKEMKLILKEKEIMKSCLV